MVIKHPCKTIHPLAQARIRQNLTQKQLAEACGLGEATIKRMEQGQTVGSTSRRLVCAFFQESALELGLIPDTGSMTTEEGNEMKRRELLKVAGLISGAFLSVPPELLHLPQLWEHAAKAVSPACVSEETLPLYQSQLELCWRLSNGKDLDALAQILPATLPAVIAAAQRSTPLQTRAARLTSIGYQLSYVLASNKEDFAQALIACQKAYDYATLANDPELQVLSLVREGVVYLYRKQPHKTLQALKRATPLKERVSPLLQARLASALAEAHGKVGHDEAVQYMHTAYEVFPTRTDTSAPPFLHFDQASLPLHEGLMLLDLGKYTDAEKAFNKIDGLHPKLPLSERSRIDVLNQQALVAFKLQKLEAFETFMSEAITSASTLRSDLRLSEAWVVYAQARLQWKQEPRIQQLAAKFR